MCFEDSSYLLHDAMPLPLSWSVPNRWLPLPVSIMPGDKAYIVFFLVWHLAFHHIHPCCQSCFHVWRWLAWASFHLLWPRLLIASVSASSICFVCAILGMSSINILPCLTFTCRLTQGISAPPLIISSISRSGISTRLQFSVHCLRHALSIVLLTLGSSLAEFLWVISWRLGIHSSNIYSPSSWYSKLEYLFVRFTQGVSPSINSL